MKAKQKVGLLLTFFVSIVLFSVQKKYVGIIWHDPVFSARANIKIGIGNAGLSASQHETGSREGEGYSLSKGQGTQSDADVDNRKSNLSIVYNVEVLLNELKKIHDKLYLKPKNDICTVRPAGCVIIGVAKSGTQELLNFLSLHPNIVAKHNLPNPNLFDRDSHLDPRKEKMPCTYSDQIGVVKTDYFFFRHEMPNKFYQFNKDLKMILLVREPIERLISAYSFTYLQKKQRKLVFTYRINDVPEIDNVFVDTKTGAVKENQFDLSHSVYDSAMERYLKLFSKEQILVLDSAEFKSTPVQVLQRVEKFLNLKPLITNDLFAYNPSKNFHCLKTLERLVCYGSDRGRAKLKDIKQETRQKLSEYFKPHNERFFNLIGQNFNWSG